MKIAPFALERYFARHEFTARYLLSSSDCEAFPMSELIAVADPETSRMWEGLRLGYTESLGHPLLRQTVAEIYEGIEPDDVLVVVPEEGIFLLMHALLEPGDHVICTFPAYQSLHEVSRSIGCEVSTWEPAEDKGWRFDMGQLEQMLRADTKLVVANFPHNPTGHIPSKDDFGELVEMVQRRGIFLLSDEMFRFLEVEEGATLPSGCELYERAFSLFGLSKTFGMPGLRMGWVVSRNKEVLERMAVLKDYTTICHNAPSEILAVIALRNRDAIIEQQLKRVQRNIDVLESFFADYGDCLRWVKPVGGSICFPRLLVEESASVFCEDLVAETGIMLVPSSLFHFGDNHVRIGFGREDLPEVVRRFADHLDRRFR
jgi:aspartate/methionine/tyrosine aminotransferase